MELATIGSEGLAVSLALVVMVLRLGKHLLLAVLKVLEPPLIHHLAPIREGVLRGGGWGAIRLGAEGTLHLGDLGVPAHHHVVDDGVGIGSTTSDDDIVRVNTRGSGGHELGNGHLVHFLFVDVVIDDRGADFGLSLMAHTARAGIHLRKWLGNRVGVVQTDTGGVLSSGVVIGVDRVGGHILVLEVVGEGLGLEGDILKHDIGRLAAFPHFREGSHYWGLKHMGVVGVVCTDGKGRHEGWYED